MKDILLTANGDLAVGKTGDIFITDSVRQAIRVRLRWFFQEWRLGPAFGIPYYEEILVKNPNDLRIKQIIRDEILTVEEVDDVRNIVLSVNTKTRAAVISFTVAVGDEIFREEMFIS